MVNRTTQTGTMTTSIQDSSAYLFVPYSAGPTRAVDDDSRQPGAYLRLGGYSGVEAKAKDNPPDTTASFYPRQHIADAGDKKVTDAAGDATKGYKGGIMLSCDGRMLMRAGEKFYLHVIDAMHIDTESTLTVFAKKAISVKTDSTVKIATVKDPATSDEDAQTLNSITIDAASKKGNYTLKSYKSTKSIGGNDFEYVDQDKYTFTMADTYSYRLGKSDSITLGETSSIFVGGIFALKMSVEITLAMSALITLYVLKFEVGILKMDFSAWKIEMKEGRLQRSTMNAKAVDIYVTTNGVDLKNTATQSTNEAVLKSVSAVKWGLESIDVNNGSVEVKMKNIVNNV